MYLAWKISSDFKDNTNNSLQKMFTKMDTAANCDALPITCDMLYDQGHVSK